jgi:hypothetical protein
MSAAIASLPTPSIELACVDGYEHLRKRGLEVGSRVLDGAQGLVLFLRRGMMSWMTEMSAAAPRPPVRPSPAEREVFVRDDRVDVMWMLASMLDSAVAGVQV